MQVFVTNCGAAHLLHTARALDKRNALAAMWCSERNRTGITPGRYVRCWPYHLAMCPFYFWTPPIWVERASFVFCPIWRIWQQKQKWPECDVVQSLMGHATEPFDFADKTGALKVLDCPNSHPTTYFGFWQRECDIFCPGDKLPVPRRMFARMNRELQRADLIIVQSRFCKESMVLNGIPAEKVMVNPMGVDTSIFTKREQVPSKTRFICVGTICLRKGHQYLFRAFQIVKKQMPEAELVCVGEYKHDFRKERRRWEGTFTQMEHLSHPLLSEQLRASTAFIFPSQEEGIARAQIEALACGLPVVGTHEGGATTLIEDGVEGFIVPGRDPSAIAEAMLRIAQDRDLNRRMGEAAYQKGAIQNTWQDYGDRLLAEYGSYLEQKGSTDRGQVLVSTGAVKAGVD